MVKYSYELKLQAVLAYLDGKESMRAIAKRYGEEWRDETGDKAILAVIQRVKELEEQMKAAVIFG